ncbi:MAG TPA: hypothetical protein VGF77_15700 [Allosphingosinicella sp.]|jgi:hypothetical protein
MSRADFYGDLVVDVEDLVISGETAASAIMLITLKDNDVNGAILKRWVLKKHGSEETLEAWARRQADDAQFKVAAAIEVAACKKREGPYANLPLLSTEPALALIRASVASHIGRQISDHEAWLIEEMFNPWLSELKLASKAKVRSLREPQIGVED